MDQAQMHSRQPRWTAVICALLLLGFAINSYSAVLTKNATVDEPTHALSGWLANRCGDFRLQPVNPSLWEAWAALPNFGTHLILDRSAPLWNDLTWAPGIEVPWAIKTLYQTPGVDGGAFINRSRAIMLLLGVLLGVLIARWSYLLAGPVAAVTAAAMFSFDPSFLAHAPLVKGDVPFSLVLLGLTFVLWRLGQKGTWVMLITSGLLCGIGINVKYSGVIFGPVLAVMLLARSMLPQSWVFLGHSLKSRRSRVGTAIATSCFAAGCCLAVTWAGYHFRFRPAPSPSVRMNMPVIFARANLVETTVDLMRTPSAQDLANHKPGAVSRFVEFANQHHLLPQAMLAGFLYQYSCVQLWPAFLDGQLYGSGRWYYFPLAMLYKTPVCELIAYACTFVVFILVGVKNFINSPSRSLRYSEEPDRPREIPAIRATSETGLHCWTTLSLLIPFTIFAWAALTTHLNIGLRNALPLFPFMQIAAGCAAAVCWRQRPRTTTLVGAVLVLGLTAETLLAWPGYIQYFNFPTGGERAGIRHLADSNLDWGQDVIGLVRWQQQHKAVHLYTKLEYSVDPKFYGLVSHPITIAAEGPNAGKPESDEPLQRGVIAVAATQLQGLYVQPWETPFYSRLRAMNPIADIGGTIYIFDFPSAN